MSGTQCGTQQHTACTRLTQCVCRIRV
jgi:hypothetical protein